MISGLSEENLHTIADVFGDVPLLAWSLPVAYCLLMYIKLLNRLKKKKPNRSHFNVTSNGF